MLEITSNKVGAPLPHIAVLSKRTQGIYQSCHRDTRSNLSYKNISTLEIRSPADYSKVAFGWGRD